MDTIEELGVVSRDRRTETDDRGRGPVNYGSNTHTAWNGDLHLRAQVAAKQQGPTKRRGKLKVVPPAGAAE
jgi:hypothetical protein